MRIRRSPPLGTGLASSTLMKDASSLVSVSTSPEPLASLPLTRLQRSSLPVARSTTRSSVATDPSRIGLKKKRASGTLVVTS
jgi:hypothetical protein